MMVPPTYDEPSFRKLEREDQLSAILTILYFIVEAGRQQARNGDDSIRKIFGT
jgi:hypothetical protein